MAPSYKPSFFDVEADTIASLGVLDVLLEPTFLSSSSDRGLILDKTQVFLNSFRQDVIRLRGDQFVRLLNRVGSGALFAVGQHYEHDARPAYLPTGADTFSSQQ